MKIGIAGFGNIGKAYTEELVKYADFYNSTEQGKKRPIKKIVIWNRTSSKVASFIDSYNAGNIADSYKDAEKSMLKQAFSEELARNKAMEEIIGFNLFDGKNLNKSTKSTLKLILSKDFEGFEDADVVFVSAGRAREKGMSRKDLVNANYPIAEKIAKATPKQAVLISVTNPADEMAEVIYKIRKADGVEAKKTIAMTGLLDSARFSVLLAKELGVDVSSISGAKVIGFHNDKMVASFKKIKINGQPITTEQLNKVQNIVNNKLPKQGARVIEQTGNSAYLTPAHASMLMTKAVLENLSAKITASAYFDNNLYTAVPIILNRQGAEVVPESDWGVSKKELEEFQSSILT